MNLKSELTGIPKTIMLEQLGETTIGCLVPAIKTIQVLHRLSSLNITFEVSFDQLKSYMMSLQKPDKYSSYGFMAFLVLENSAVDVIDNIGGDILTDLYGSNLGVIRVVKPIFVIEGLEINVDTLIEINLSFWQYLDVDKLDPLMELTAATVLSGDYENALSYPRPSAVFARIPRSLMSRMKEVYKTSYNDAVVECIRIAGIESDEMARTRPMLILYELHQREIITLFGGSSVANKNPYFWQGLFNSKITGYAEHCLIVMEVIDDSSDKTD